VETSAGGGCSISYTVYCRVQNHIRFRSRDKQVVLKPLEGYVRFRTQLLFMFASRSTLPIPMAHGLRCGSAAARLLGLWLRIAPGAWMSLVKRSPTECGVSECDRETSTMRRPWPTRGCCAMKTNIPVNKKQYQGVRVCGCQIILGHVE
jgi:hypothetical protein